MTIEIHVNAAAITFFIFFFFGFDSFQNEKLPKINKKTKKRSPSSDLMQISCAILLFSFVIFLVTQILIKDPVRVLIKIPDKVFVKYVP